MSNEKWTRVSKGHSCPVCKSDSWCTVSPDGAVALCMRVEAGSFDTKESGGGTAFLHRLKDGPRRSSRPRGGYPKPPPDAPRAEPDALHAAYSALLGGLSLSAKHREALQKRGLADEAIDRNQYRSLPVQGRSRVAALLRERFGDTLLRVPGFVVRDGANGRYLTIAGAKGVLVPCRDTQGRIVALKVRRDEEGEGSRYTYVSSTKDGGPGPGTLVHAPLGTPAPSAIVRLTEGELKADIAFALGELPALSVPGVGNWKPALDVLRGLGCSTVRLAFDADAWEKPHVAKHLSDCAGALAAAGFAVELERWEAGDGKGVDDLLAAGKTPTVLIGDQAQEAIREAVGEPEEDEASSDAILRLHEVLNAGGAEALYKDRELLQALADLKRGDPAGYAAAVASMGSRVKVRQLEKALQQYTRRSDAERGPAPPPYLVEYGAICRMVQTGEGPITVPLCNFDARIVEDVQHDDGADQRRSFSIEGRLANGRGLPRIEVAADDFVLMNWVVGKWGTQAVVNAGQSMRDHLRAALQTLSEDVPRRTVYGHLGWRDAEGRLLYLHAGGAIGQVGGSDVPVAVPDSLGGFTLPEPPTGGRLVTAIQASLSLLRLGPARVMVPLLAAAYRAVLGGTDFSIHLAGRTGTFKSEAAALVQQHFGSGLDARHLPANWSSTANAMEGLAFLAKDTVLVVDDFCPTGSSADVQRMHRDADRLLRGQGNSSGRQRMRADASLRTPRPPRGLILSTGEDVPRGQSLRARMLVLELSPGDLGLPGNAPRLTRCQADAASGLYAEAMAGFIRWLCPRLDEVRSRLREEAAKMRGRVPPSGHARTPGIVIDLHLGLLEFLDFAEECGAISSVERVALASTSWKALLEAGAAQAEQAAAAEPASHFLRLLGAAVASGRAHFADPEGNAPKESARWGWRTEPGGQPRPGGERAGWVAEGGVYLDPDASFAVVQRLAEDSGDGFGLTAHTLRRRLNEQGLLASTDEQRQKLPVRRTFQGERREVLHVRWAGCEAEPQEGGEAPGQGPGGPQEGGLGRMGRSATGGEDAAGPENEWGEV